MIKTSDFKTKTMCVDRKNPITDGDWLVAMDVGYSGVKGMSPNKVYCFPAYAKKSTGQMISLGKDDGSGIQYKDANTGTVWLVGEAGYDSLDTSDTKDSVNALFGRNRYFSEMFLVIARVGIAIGMIENEYGNSLGKKLTIQTGLPPAYAKADTPLIKEALSGVHDFSVKIGNSKWINFNFTLSESDIKVIPQPMGTLMSVSSLMDGTPVPEAAKYFKKKVLIFDGGFGTLDDFDISGGRVVNVETFDDLGMKRVMKETTDRIFEIYHTEIPIVAMQKYLGDGFIRSFNRKKHATTQEPFADILEKASKEICHEALARMDNIYNNFINHDYFIITGGTGEAWYPMIKDYFKDMSTLKIVPGNQNDNLPYTFSNVRGYYIQALMHLKALARINKKAGV